MNKKKFDCVVMKREIQEQQRQMLKGLSPREQSRLMEQEIHKDAELAKWWTAAKQPSKLVA